MRKLRIFEHISLDGVIQAAGGKEDGYPYGGWALIFVLSMAQRERSHFSLYE